MLRSTSPDASVAPPQPQQPQPPADAADEARFAQPRVRVRRLPDGAAAKRRRNDGDSKDPKFCVSDQQIILAGERFQIVYRRPPISYADLITYAIAQNGQRKLKLNAIYNFLTSTFGYFKHNPQKRGWENSIRHNLSMKSKCRFRKIKEDSDSEKGCFWSLNPNEPFLRESIDNAWETVLKLESWPGIAYYRLSPEECSSEAPLLPPTLFSEDSKRFYNDLYMFDEFGGFGKFSVIDAAGTASGSLSSSSAAFALRQIPHGYIHGFLPLPPPPFHNTTVATGGDVLCTGATALTIGNAGSGPEKASKSALKHIQKLASSLSALSSSTSRPFESQSSVLHERSGLVPLMRSASDSQVFATTQFRSDGQCGLAGAWPSSDDDSDGDMDDHDMDESDSNFGSHEASQSRFFSRSSSNSQLLPSHSSRQPFSQEQQHYANRPENNNWMEFVYSSSNSHHHSSHNCQKHQHQNNVHYSHLGCKIMAACGGYMTPVTSTVTTTATTSSSSSEYMFDLFNEGTEAAETEPSLLFGSPEQNSDKFFSATPLIHMSSVDIERLIADPSVFCNDGGQ